MKLRPLTAPDRRPLERLLAATAAFNAADVAVALELIDDILAKGEHSDYRAVCAEAEAEALAGFICFGRIPLTEASFDLYWIVVGPNHQGRGVASRLLAAIEPVCSQAGGTQLFAETSSLDAYAPARAFYEATGFHLVSRIPDFYAPGNDRLTYAKRLGGASLVA
ncbi:MAG: GNAT family N-acetyltransferase [Pseudomonadota bacterium]